MVCGVPRYTDAGSVCDPYGGQPVEEPSQRAVADIGCCHLGGRRRAAVHAPRRIAEVYPITAVVAGCDFAAGPDIPDFGSSRQDLVLSPARFALIRLPFTLPDGDTIERQSRPGRSWSAGSRRSEEHTSEL